MDKKIKKLVAGMTEQKAKRALVALVSACLSEFDFEEGVAFVLNKYKLHPPDDEFTGGTDGADKD